MSERLQKILSQLGLGSRREVERWIEQGLVAVNGKIAKLGDGATAEDTLSVRGQIVANPLKGQMKTRIMIYHKPVGEISSRNDPKHQRTVFDKLPPLRQGRWVQVGRLDINTSGLLIFTNNGDLANRLMHPKFELEREYSVRVHGQVKDEALKAMLKGVELDDGIAKFKKIQLKGGEGTNTWYNVILTEGRNREVRRLWQSQGIEVSRLIRIRYGKLTMPRSLARGNYKELSIKEVEAFLSTLNS
ncbi:MAG: pseudouridine synthase [Tatlockia sp.]|nr:pseudouridine synthase [Tatlockia sp.]